MSYEHAPLFPFSITITTFCHTFRVVNGRKSVEPGVKAALTAQKYELEDYYHIEDINYEKKNEDDTIDTITLSGLCQNTERNDIVPHNMHS